MRHDLVHLLRLLAPTTVRMRVWSAAAYGVSYFFPGDGAELKSGEMRPECVQPLSFQRRFGNRTWVTSKGQFITRSPGHFLEGFCLSGRVRRAFRE